MAIRPTKEQIKADLLHGFGKKRVRKTVKFCAEKGGRVNGSLALAISNRESNNRNIAADGGHGRGTFQIDDRWNPEFLGKVRGAISGTWRLTLTKALTSNYVPGLIAGLRWCRYIVAQNYQYALRQGVPAGRPALRVAVAAYNCGPYYAVKGWREYSDPDRFTTGGDYSRDVFARRRMVDEILAEWKMV